MREAELAGVVGFLLIGSVALLLGASLAAGGGESAPEVGIWMLLGSVPVLALGVWLLRDWRRTYRPR